MTKFEDNISPYLSFVEGSAPSSPAATNFKLYYDSADHLLKWKNSAGTVTTIATGSTASILLGYNNYAPGSPAALVQTSATMADADATNMKVTFTAPTSTNVLVRLTGCARIDATGSGAGARALWGLRESSSDIAGGMYVAFAEAALPANMLVSQSVAFVLTGLSAGSHTYKWSIGGGGGTNNGGVYCSTATPAVMEVWSI